jgi:hypothetical protein
MMRVISLTLHANNLPETGKRQYENQSTHALSARDRRNRRTTPKEEICAIIFSAKRNAAHSDAVQHRNLLLELASDQSEFGPLPRAATSLLPRFAFRARAVRF